VKNKGMHCRNFVEQFHAISRNFTQKLLLRYTSTLFHRA